MREFRTLGSVPGAAREGGPLSRPVTSVTTAGYQAAVANVTAVGLSFGGGCFFENGIGTTDGSGSFELNSFSATAG